MSIQPKRPPTTATVEPDKKKLKPTADADPILLNQTDIWVTKILPFLGPGQYIIVAGVNHRLNELYQDYFSTIPKAPMVRNVLGNWNQEPAVVTNTFYSAAFCNVPCAELWD